MNLNKKTVRTCFYLWVFIAFASISFPLNANLLITPLQVVIEGRERSTEIVLINTSQNTNTYRLHWLQLEQVESAGGYVAVAEADRAARQDLEDIAVFTPRQVTLKPNEKQVVRIGIRRPPELADGEYKSHLRFEILPELSSRPDQNVEVSPDKTRFGVQVHASYSVPVVYRSGEYDLSIAIQQPSFDINEKTSQIIVNLPVERAGTHGVIGQIDIYHKGRNGKETLIAQHGNAALYTEITRRDFKILTSAKSLNGGSLRVQFIKAEGSSDQHQLLAEETFQLN